MKAMILAAGLGTRLRPLTDKIPKALVKIGDTPLLEIAIRKLLHYGFSDIIINIHHHPDQVLNFLSANNNFGATISISDERDLLLDTGGGLKKAASFFNNNESFILYNCDIVTDLNLNSLYDYHIVNRVLCTLAVRERETSRYFLFDEDNTLCGWWNKKTGEKRIVRDSATTFRPKAFSGISVIDPKSLSMLPGRDIFSMVDFYLSFASVNKIISYDHTETKWADIGKIEALDRMKSFHSGDYI
jgi:NDP-sugar pyrophosphorylase family protein